MCVVKNTALYCLHLEIIDQRLLLLSGSKPVVGSSKNTITGLPTKLIATESLLFIPPESYFVLNFVKSYKLTSSIAFLTLYLTLDDPFSLA